MGNLGLREGKGPTAPVTAEQQSMNATRTRISLIPSARSQPPQLLLRFNETKTLPPFSRQKKVRGWGLIDLSLQGHVRGGPGNSIPGTGAPRLTKPRPPSRSSELCGP